MPKRALVIQITIFLFLTALSLLFLLRPGVWLYQDASYWSKNNLDSLHNVIGQYRTFAFGSFSYGFDTGIFVFTRVIPTTLAYLLFQLFGSTFSQITFVLTGILLSFFAFYQFSGIFFPKQQTRFLLSLIFVFNPLFFSLLNQSYIQAYSAAVLLTWAVYRYLKSETSFRLASYLFLIIVATYLSTSYLRFIQITAITAIPYLGYLIIKEKLFLRPLRFVLLGVVGALVFSPSFFVLFNQRITSQPIGSENFASNYSQFIPEQNTHSIFNLFQSINLKLYQPTEVYSILGVLIFAFFLYLFLQYKGPKKSLFLLNLSLFLIGILLFGLASLFSSNLYLQIIDFLPFVQNSPIYALFFVSVPFLVLLGYITQSNPRYLQLFAAAFIAISIFPLLNLSDPQLQKLNPQEVPTPYANYFINPDPSLIEPTYYVLDRCWPAKWMLGNKSVCFNNGLKYKKIQENNPRVLFGKAQIISKQLVDTENFNLNNLRVTHNLKNIIAPNDYLPEDGLPAFLQNRYQDKIKNAKKSFSQNKEMTVKSNPYFEHFYYKNSNQYDYFLYAANTLVYKDVSQMFDNTLKLNARPVVTDQEIDLKLAQNVQIEYKSSFFNPTRYYLKISQWDKQNPMFLQMNALFNSEWRLKAVDKSYFDNRVCASSKQRFPISGNIQCAYKNDLIELEDPRLFTSPNIAQNTHFQSNWLGNGWIINPEDLPEEVKNQEDIYLVLIYQKQIYFGYFVWAAFITAGIIMTIAVFFEVYTLSLRIFNRTT